jgi:hypothetical protein
LARSNAFHRLQNGAELILRAARGQFIYFNHSSPSQQLTLSPAPSTPPQRPKLWASSAQQSH